MGDQVGDGEIGGDVGICEAEAGDVIGDVIVPGELSVLDQQPQGCGGKGFGTTGDIENIARFGFAAGWEIGLAVALVEHDLAIFDDGDGGTGDLEVFDCFWR